MRCGCFMRYFGLVYQGQPVCGKCWERHRSWKESSASRSRRTPGRGRRREHPCRLGNVRTLWHLLSFSPDKSRTQSPVKAGQAFSPEDLSKAGTKAEVGEPARFVPGGDGERWRSILWDPGEVVCIMIMSYLVLRTVNGIMVNAATARAEAPIKRAFGSCDVNLTMMMMTMKITCVVDGFLPPNCDRIQCMEEK